MANGHLIALPAQELSALQCAVTAPQFATLFDQLPAFRAALQAPVADDLLQLAYAAEDAFREVCGNTQYPEDWDDVRELANQLIQQKKAQIKAQANTTPRPEAKKYGNKVCTCCGGGRVASVFAKACNVNFFSIPHLGFDVNSYMPTNLGIPGQGDGPQIDVCLDCGRVVNGKYPLTDETLKQRIAEYENECL